MNFLFKLSLIPSSVLGTFLIYKTFFGVPKYKGNEDLTGKVAIITGGSSGIGQEIAYKLALRNATVIIGCRDIVDCRAKRMKIYSKTKNDKLYCSELDLESYDSIKDFVTRLNKKFKEIDILVQNAGYKAGDKREMSKEFTEKQLAVNAIGPFLLTKLLIPLLAAAKTARVLFLICPQYAKGNIDVSDINQQEKYDKKKAFNQSQLMRVLLMKHFANDFSPSKISFNACDPGPTYSNFHKNENYNKNFVSRWIFAYINLLILRNTWQAVETPIKCCVSDELLDTSGLLYRDLKICEIDPVAMDVKMLCFVYLLCEKWTGSPSLSIPNNKL